MQIIKPSAEIMAPLAGSSLTVKFICDRGVTGEIYRLMTALFCRETSGSNPYTILELPLQAGSDIVFIEPLFLHPETKAYKRWEEACSDAEDAYFDLLEWGCTSQEAKAVLPSSLKTEIIMTADVREWRIFLKASCDKAAHIQLRELTVPLLSELRLGMVTLFEDIWKDLLLTGKERI